jgi:hypothetical protein
MVAEKTGVDGSVITRMLPIATTAVGAFSSKRVASGDNLSDTANSLASAGQEGILGAAKTLAAKILDSASLFQRSVLNARLTEFGRSLGTLRSRSRKSKSGRKRQDLE